MIYFKITQTGPDHTGQIDIIENNVISNYDYSNSNEDEMDIEYVVTLDGNNGNILKGPEWQKYC